MVVTDILGSILQILGGGLVGFLTSYFILSQKVAVLKATYEEKFLNKELVFNELKIEVKELGIVKHKASTLENNMGYLEDQHKESIQLLNHISESLNQVKNSISNLERTTNDLKKEVEKLEITTTLKFKELLLANPSLKVPV